MTSGVMPPSKQQGPSARELSPYGLRVTRSPLDTDESARWVIKQYDRAIRAIKDQGGGDDASYEFADEAVFSILEEERLWQLFTDLRGWKADIGGLVEDVNALPMNNKAELALWVIAVHIYEQAEKSLY